MQAEWDVVIEKTTAPKCARCWKHDRYVGTLPIRDLCGRCYNTLTDMDINVLHDACDSHEELLAVLHTFDVSLYTPEKV